MMSGMGGLEASVPALHPQHQHQQHQQRSSNASSNSSHPREFPIVTDSGTIEGPVEKWTNYVTVWQGRWLVLDPEEGTLDYYVGKKKQGTAKAGLHLKLATIILDESSDDQFMVTAPGVRTFHLRARDTKERARWHHVLMKVQIDIQARSRLSHQLHIQQAHKAHPNAAAAAADSNATVAGSAGQPASALDASASSSSGSATVSAIAGVQQTRALASAIAKASEARSYSHVMQQQVDSLLEILGASASEEARETALLVKASAHAMIKSLDYAVHAVEVAAGKAPTPLRSLSIPPSPQPVTHAEATTRRDSTSSGPLKKPTLARSISSESVDSDTSFYDAQSDLVSGDDSTTLTATSTGEPSVPEISKPGEEQETTEADLGADGYNSDQDESQAILDSDDEEEDSEDADKSVLMHILSQLRIGMDLTKVVLPTFILEKRSLLEMYADFMAHPDIFVGVAQLPDPRTRFMEVLRWYLSAFHVGRKSSVAKKPYNPILGETFRCQYITPNGGPLNFVAEQISHHPPVSAFYAECPNTKIRLDAHIWTKSKFLGLSVGVINVGEARIALQPTAANQIPGTQPEVYVLTFPSAYARSILSIPWVELASKTTLTCARTGFSATIDFHAKPTFGGKPHQVSAEVMHVSSPKPIIKLSGEWNGVISSKNMATGQTSVFLNTKVMSIIKKQVTPVSSQNEFESRRLWKDVTEALKSRQVDAATVAKAKLEDRQRAEAKERKERGVEWRTKLFERHDDGAWRYNGSGGSVYA
ncbi:oxysterol binding protein [Capsaspora owczarzaki ATCC 30864]|uniref:oxysterol binding protein n=1 Tax=Capsaspora owczarzaki (strain ATCC 30864) TaxID=595528 RepID=UPI0003521A77|nr:oxysterol binding protein [Capsaspora owczarzaki ATCC 30864]|eukprot:XP_004364608.2 oxysterol binding protein [Capsaspora owczarzaki ATCC 30864]